MKNTEKNSDNFVLRSGVPRLEKKVSWSCTHNVTIDMGSDEEASNIVYSVVEPLENSYDFVISVDGVDLATVSVSDKNETGSVMHIQFLRGDVCKETSCLNASAVSKLVVSHMEATREIPSSSGTYMRSRDGVQYSVLVYTDAHTHWHCFDARSEDGSIHWKECRRMVTAPDASVFYEIESNVNVEIVPIEYD